MFSLIDVAGFVCEHKIKSRSFSIQIIIEILFTKEDEAFSVEDEEDAEDPAHQIP